ncbi:peptidoglycan-binding protein LysM [Leptobacterium flavescens]|uniref:Peptidoglycan-binding protein LysM n=1 Tax=Leptobacterium flavescens TaxID=472055 RepID=A0A6P0UN32_9FLAO|nr:peptidoglycan-binding protein LysM [Leptobacterium flavescens]NER13288.1 peptidoglycan-binding protein LysM [Leptobacterium flavescens]
MGKSVLKLTILVAAVVTISLGFTLKTKKVIVHENYVVKEPLEYTVNIEKPESITPTQIITQPPFLGKSFVGFKEALAFKESRGDYFITNYLGYLGKYQFGASTLELLGVYNKSLFLSNPQLQEKAFIANTARNKWILRKDIQRYVGRTFNGVLVTESGILAAAHLGGAGNVKKYLRSGGKIVFEDANGASVQYYMKKFSGYDTSHIEPMRTAKAASKI